MKKDQNGFSLIEMLLVVAIAGILLAAGASMLGWVQKANTDKTVEAISSALDKQQIRAMSKADVTYMYLYQVDHKCYMLISEKAPSSTDASKQISNTDLTASNGTQIATSSVTIAIKDSSGAERVISSKTNTDNTPVVISFLKNGSFSTQSYTDFYRPTFIEVRGRDNYEITLVQASGKHIVTEL